MTSPRAGVAQTDLDTPALCLDLDVLEENIRRVAALCADAGVAWRPHVKGHRSGWIGAKEVASGAVGLTCGEEAPRSGRAGG